MAKAKVTAMICDNPACGATRITNREEPAQGYYLGKGAWHHDGGGGQIPATYACSEKCLVPAVKAQYDRAWNG